VIFLCGSPELFRLRQGDLSVMDIGFVYRLAALVHCLLYTNDDQDISGALTVLNTFITDSANEEISLEFSRSRGKAIVLRDTLESIFQTLKTKNDLMNVRNRINEFEISFFDELSKVHVLHITKKGNLSIHSLVAGASKGFSHSSSLSDRCRYEIDESGKCLACNRPTASGFHILRSVEVCIEDYFSAGNLPMPPTNRQNWGQYITDLKNNGASRPVTDSLQFIKDNFRNPLMHPHDGLDIGEAIKLFCVCEQMTAALVNDMKARGFI
jgi:hypothetical protein